MYYKTYSTVVSLGGLGFHYYEDHGSEQHGAVGLMPPGGSVLEALCQLWGAFAASWRPCHNPDRQDLVQ